MLLKSPDNNFKGKVRVQITILTKKNTESAQIMSSINITCHHEKQDQAVSFNYVIQRR
jgi:hypothetical protein